MAGSSYAAIVETRQDPSSNSPPTIGNYQHENVWEDEQNPTMQRRGGGPRWEADPALTNNQQGRSIWSSSASTSTNASCYPPRSMDDTQSYTSSVVTMHNQPSLGSIGDARLGPHQHVNNTFHGHYNGFVPASMMNNRMHDNYTNSYNRHHDDLTASLGQLNISAAGGGDDMSNAGTSLNSMTSTSVPGVVGVSSASTGGNSSLDGTSSLWRNARQQQRLNQYPQQHDSNFVAGHYPAHSHHPRFNKYQSSLQQQHSYQHEFQQSQFISDPTAFPSGAPPGFVSMSIGGTGLPYQHSSMNVGGSDDMTPMSHDASRSINQVHRRKKGGTNNGRRRRTGKGRNQVESESHMNKNSNRDDGSNSAASYTTLGGDAATVGTSKASSEALRMLMKPPCSSNNGDGSVSSTSALTASRLNLDGEVSVSTTSASHKNDVSTRVASSSNTNPGCDRPILPTMEDFLQDPLLLEDALDDATCDDDDDDYDYDESSDDVQNEHNSVDKQSSPVTDGTGGARSKKRDWLLRMSRRLSDVPVGELDPSNIPLSAIMNAWAKTKSAHGASMVEMWLKRAQQEYDAGNHKVVPTTKMYTMAVDAWAKSGGGRQAAERAEEILSHMHNLYQTTKQENLRPTTGIFNAVINAWARSREKIAPIRAEQILEWMENLHRTVNPDIQPDKYTFNTVIHAYAKSGGTNAAIKAQELLSNMHKMYKDGNLLAKPDTITYNVVINAWAKSGGKGAAAETEKLLSKMHQLHEQGDPDIKPNVVTYGAVIDSYAKSGEKGAASRADNLLAQMIQLHQTDPVKHADLRPNTYVFNTVINCWAKSKELDAASKAEEMLLAMSRLHSSGMPNLKPDAFTYTAVIDAWAKSGYRGAASRADQLLDKMEAKYMSGDMDLKPNTFTYNAVINALAKSGEPGAAARAERVLHNMVNRHRNGGSDDVKPTTINFNTVLDAWAKSGGGRQAAERAEEILEWMDRLHKGGNPDVKPDTITFNAVLDAWARSGDRPAPHRMEQIVDHMDELYRAGNSGVKPDTYTYNTLINGWAKSSERGSAARAEHVLSVMEKRYSDGDKDFKPNTRTHTSVIDAWAKSGEKGAARHCEGILNNMSARYDATGDPDVKPNVHTANAVCNACAFTKLDEDRPEALQIAFRVFDWLSSQPDMQPDAYTYTILLSVCANLLPREDGPTRYAHARAFFESCCKSGYVNDYVLRKLRQTVSEEEYLGLVDYRVDTSASSMPPSWTRNAGSSNRHNVNKVRKNNGGWSQRRRGK